MANKNRPLDSVCSDHPFPDWYAYVDDVGDPSHPLLRYSRKKLNTAILVATILQGPCESSLTHFPESMIP